MKRRVLYVATGNRGKLRDFAAAAESVSGDWSIAPLPGLDRIAAPPETGATFYANAAAKALAYAAHAPECVVLADDSGLEVDALDGAPGVYSARYAERLGCAAASDETEDARNNRCLLRELADLSPHAPLTARYRCSLVAALDGVLLATADGVVEGEIVRVPRGERGFGYDPLFLLPLLASTMAELDTETRLSLSHRNMALRRLLSRLTKATG